MLLETPTPLKFTVITVCYNAAETIETTIRSVLWQDYAHLEYIIIDGQSTDATLDIVRKYEDKIARVVSEPDDGVYDAMNKGIEHSGAGIINFMNANDTFAAPDVASQVAHAFKAQHQDKMILYGDVIRRYGARHIYRRASDMSTPSLSALTSINHQATFYRRHAFDLVGLFDKECRVVADLDWLARAVKVHKLSYAHLPIVVCNYDAAEGISGRGYYFEERWRVWNKYFSKREILHYRLIMSFFRRLAYRIDRRDFSLPRRISRMRDRT